MSRVQDISDQSCFNHNRFSISQASHDDGVQSLARRAFLATSQNSSKHRWSITVLYLVDDTIFKIATPIANGPCPGRFDAIWTLVSIGLTSFCSTLGTAASRDGPTLMTKVPCSAAATIVLGLDMEEIVTARPSDYRILFNQAS